MRGDLFKSPDCPMMLKDHPNIPLQAPHGLGVSVKVTIVHFMSK